MKPERGVAVKLSAPGHSYFINLCKVAGPTSAAQLADVKRLFNLRKTGHCGTLDPLAEGVLVVGVNKATKLMPFLSGDRKTYAGRMRLGVTSDSLDTETELRTVGPIFPIDDAVISSICRRFTGSIEQIPPRYSAVKIDGERAYARARKGRDVSLRPRTVTIHTIELARTASDELSFTIVCSSGTYIRSVVRDIGTMLGTGAVMTELTRTAVGMFRMENSLTLADLALENSDLIKQGIISVDTFLSRIFPVLDVSADVREHLRNGRDISAADLTLEEGITYIRHAGEPAFLLERSGMEHHYRLYLGR